MALCNNCKTRPAGSDRYRNSADPDWFTWCTDCRAAAHIVYNSGSDAIDSIKNTTSLVVLNEALKLELNGSRRITVLSAIQRRQRRIASNSTFAPQAPR